MLLKHPLAHWQNFRPFFDIWDIPKMDSELSALETLQTRHNNYTNSLIAMHCKTSCDTAPLTSG